MAMRQKIGARMRNMVDITVVLDRSGSMASIKDDTIGGFNNFVKSQAETGVPTTFTLVQFDHEYDLVFEAKSAKEVKPLDDNTYCPRGTTALLDAVGRAILSTGTRLSNMPETYRPSKVMFVIITDGFENASTEFTNSRIKEMISHQGAKYNWQFVFLGANQDSFATGGSFGIHTRGITNFTANAIGTQAAWGALCYNTTNYVSDSSANACYSWSVTPDSVEEDIKHSQS